MTTAGGSTPDRSNRAAIVRMIVGLLQGLVLYFLFESAQSRTWPSTDGPLFAALGAAAIYAPLILVASLSYLRPTLLAGWAVAIVVICASLAWYDIVRAPATPPAIARIYPSPQFWLALSVGLFIAHCQFVAGAVDRRLIARYSTYFDTSWKYGVQVVLAVLFTSIFWLLLWLGAALFALIKIDFPTTLLQKPWFAIPATTLALTCAIHITDVRVGIVRGVRTLSCNLLSWLLPLMALIAVGFVAALPFTGLEPLWSTRRASSILLVAAASLIFLVNSAYQDGARADDAGAATRISSFLRVSMVAASTVLVPISLLAAYGIALRTGQYGWTSNRVVAAACTAVALGYALGYFAAAIRWNTAFAWLEATNVTVSFVVLAILLALFTPLADPARVSVADQVRRLNARQIAQDKFDYQFLRFDTGRYGTEALRALAEQRSLPLAAERAAAMLERKTRYEARSVAARINAEERAANVSVVQPQGKPLPREFLETDWGVNRRSYLIPSCLTSRAKCNAILADLDGDGADEIVILPLGAVRAFVFRPDTGSSWDYLGEIHNIGCEGVRDALLSGNFSIVPPKTSEIEVAGRRLRLNWPADCNVGRIAK